jgi:4-amino-4-deoxy-L-arabinose transferase-like glycosyltransferase
VSLLTSLPVFTDEANYIDWGWRMTHVPGHLFYSLYDAKQPLSMWLFGLSQYLFPDPLFAGRIVSVVFGIISAFGIYYLTKELFDKQVAQLTTISYLLSPLYLFFNTQALMEAHLVAVGIWSLLFLHKLIKTEKIKFAFLLGLVLGIGFLVKSSSWFWIALTGIYLLKKPILGLWTLFTFLFVSSPLLLNTYFWQTINLNSRYASFGFRPENLRAILEVPFIQMTPIILILGILGVYKLRKNILLISWFLVPLIIQFFVAKFLISRYLVPFLWPLFIFAANIINRKSYITILVILICLPLNFIQLISPIKYFEILDKVTKYSYSGAYISAEASGWAVNDTVNWFDNLAKEQKMIVGFGLYSGNPEIGTMIYLQRHKNIVTTFFDAQLFKQDLSQYNCLEFDLPVYLVTRDKHAAGLARFVDLVREFKNPHGDNVHYVFKVKDICSGTTLKLNLTRQK